MRVVQIMDAKTQGRNDLHQWEDHKPHNFFSSDANLQNVLQRYLPHEEYLANLHAFEQLGEASATVIDANAKLEDQIGNHPQLNRWSHIGERQEEISFHPNHNENGHLIWRSGILAMQSQAGTTVAQMALFYLLNHNGEAGHMCSLACTSGLIRALQQVASHEVREKFLPPLLSDDFEQMQHGAQFLTEVQGGSDVGSNTVIAIDQQEGTWRISGEKWFCSNINADQFLLTARPANAVGGTKGLGLFLVPRKLDDGRINNFHIRRLKDKLGTRTLASAEVDFQDAIAYPVGPIESGFHNTVNLVLNTSRLMNAVACAGIIRRAYIEAQAYASHRQAFGKPIREFPLVQETLAELLCTSYAAAASSFYLAHLVDRIDLGIASEDDQQVYRLLVNVNKYITSIQGTNMVHWAIEVLGGNGAIESFSILPRLYRDMVVLESWEGTHNVLCIQVMRDIARFDLLPAFERNMRFLLNQVKEPTLLTWVDTTMEALERIPQLMRRIGGNPHLAQTHARRIVDIIAFTTQASLLLTEADDELAKGKSTAKPQAAQFFIQQHLLPDYDPIFDAGYDEQIHLLSQHRS